MIAVRELGYAEGTFSVSLEIEGGRFGPVEVRDPFGAEGDEREAALEWYFEAWLRFPMLDVKKAAAAALSIAEYGDGLFDQLFAEPRARAAYERWRNRPGLRRLEIAGSPAFQRLHWEALRDPERKQALATEASLVRASRQAGIDLAEFDRDAPTIRVLVVTARPGGAKDVGYRTISRPLIEAMGDAGLPVEIDLLRPGTYPALVRHLEARRERPYHVVHFDLHGALMSHAQAQAAMRGEGAAPDALTMRYGRGEQIAPFEGEEGFLVFEPEKRPARPEDPRQDLASATEVAALLAQYRVPIAILNACQSGKQAGGERETSLGARLLDAGARNVVAMSYSVTVSAAAKMMPMLYRALLSPQPLGEALRRARLELANDTRRRAYFNEEIHLQDWILPVLYQREEAELAPRRMYPEEEEAWLERRARERAAEPRTATGSFLGRDLDILEIERRLGERNLLLVYGGGGTGKTTLLRHLGAWWGRTGWIESVDYFGYDDRAWTIEAILAELATQLLDPAERRGFPLLSAAAQGEKIVQALRRRRRLLILDNLESATAEAFAIRNELPENQRTEIAAFLDRLAGGGSLVLLGSRGPVPWLAPATGGAAYLLGGLDAEAASDLAARVFARAGIIQDMGSDAMKRLMRLLAGHPLALEVVLPNLAQQSPEDVLAALSEGAAGLDADDEARTASILACVEYSHAHLAPEAQRLLECLAPFKAAIYAPALNRYAKELAQEPALADLPVDGWETMLQAVATWGLVQPHPHPRAARAGYLAVQPILPWFLERRLAAPERAEARVAIHRAFRRFVWVTGGALVELANSRNADERQLGVLLIEIEHETLATALEQALAAHERIMSFYYPLSLHYDRTRQEAAGERFARKVIAALEAYPPETLNDDRRIAMVTAIRDTANRLLALHQLDAAQDGYKTAFPLLDAIKGESEALIGKLRAGILHQLGRVAQERRDFASAEEDYRKALEIYLRFRDEDSAASTYHQLGILAQEGRNFASAEEAYHKALEIKLRLGDEYSAASTFGQLGKLGWERGDLSAAEEATRQALKIFLKFGDEHSAGSTYHLLGVVAEEHRNYASAEEEYRKALEIKLRFGDEHSAGSTYHQLGMVAQARRDEASAEEAYHKALEIFVRFDDEHSAALTYHQLGSVAQERLDFALAEEEYRKALEIKLRVENKYSAATTYHHLGMVAQEYHDFASAEAAYAKALEIFVRFLDQHNAAITLGGLARLANADPPRREQIITKAAELTEMSQDEVEALFRQVE